MRVAILPTRSSTECQLMAETVEEVGGRKFFGTNIQKLLFPRINLSFGLGNLNHYFANIEGSDFFNILSHKRTLAVHKTTPQFRIWMPLERSRPPHQHQIFRYWSCAPNRTLPAVCNLQKSMNHEPQCDRPLEDDRHRHRHRHENVPLHRINGLPLSSPHREVTGGAP